MPRYQETATASEDGDCSSDHCPPRAPELDPSMTRRLPPASQAAHQCPAPVGAARCSSRQPTGGPIAARKDAYQRPVMLDDEQQTDDKPTGPLSTLGTRASRPIAQDGGEGRQQSSSDGTHLEGAEPRRCTRVCPPPSGDWPSGRCKSGRRCFAAPPLFAQAASHSLGTPSSTRSSNRAL